MSAIITITEETLFIGVLVFIIAGAWLAHRTGLLAAAEFAVKEKPNFLRAGLLVSAIVLLFALREDIFGLLMLATVLIYVLACFGLTIQMGFAGLTNFGAAAFMGAGGYTVAMLGRFGEVPGLISLISAGAVSVVIGLVLLAPVLRTRGHYAALTTLAFSVMFTVYVEASDVLGGPQGIKVPGLVLFGWDFSKDILLGGYTFNSFTNYVILTGGLVGLSGLLLGLMNRSWIGVWLDVVRLDETAASIFGLRVWYWKLFAFTLGNFLLGLAGAIYAQMTGFIAPANFQLGDSLAIVSILILGGIGNIWGILPATLLVVLLPEKLQIVQEYRFLIFAFVVMVVLIVRPSGLLPRRVRRLQEGSAS
ncbi:branched-chain amino acid ABC transporter permease [Rhizobium binxianense]|uniref:branched-chain amino acid ABC transporter permease n=1 Tax=Rhizobium binxianense TaxID=3024242 RepID=UPI00235F4795|nr:branched-chain amino acid ABC transporter permease [Rhizobium sp. MJ37]MDC9837805.1 branched-chain amino acid ABC transporter permease [Rhizobium sp. MJ37]